MKIPSLLSSVNSLAAVKATMLACALGLAVSSAHAAVGDFERAVAAYRQGDHQAAVRLWRPMAEKGQVDAQYNLGVMHYSGDGIKQDYAEAAKWFRKAAEQGDRQAGNYLGLMYLNGEGVKQSESEARKWFGLMRQHHHDHAQMAKWQAQLAEMRKLEDLRAAYEASRLNADQKLSELRQAAGMAHRESVKLAGLPAGQ